MQNGMSSSCESTVFDDWFHGKYVKINPAGTLLRNGNNEAVTTLQLNWYNYLKGNNFLKLSFHSSAFFELADVICVGE
ncbi:unnamed protein product [Oikopleura dioica]|uniref:Uncharacterized protein n=1 Tax=Oikopleura dioica TaxID=34765 RepID=E4Y4I5_OIKDI|nr:unnamed protein product [Oikopleura dioica]